MYYSFLRFILFLFPPEFAHTFTLKILRFLHHAKLLKPREFSAPQNIMGLSFKNLIGLAAGLDKNGEYIDALAALGFGFIEIGTVTPHPQPGNPKPRLFRLPKVKALINRLGFNSKGVDYLITQVKQATYRGILGINIGKNFDTPIENAVDDYLFCMKKVYPYASYITINISSPNTLGLRDLQSEKYLNNLLSVLKQAQKEMTLIYNKYVPLVVKISPDLNDEELKMIAQNLLINKIDGVIATNTTISHQAVEKLKYGKEQGGLSGEPLFEKSTKIVEKLNVLLQDKIPIIGVGGILNAENAKEKINAGASLLQIYTGLIYVGPKLIRDILLY